MGTLSGTIVHYEDEDYVCLTAHYWEVNPGRQDSFVMAVRAHCQFPAQLVLLPGSVLMDAESKIKRKKREDEDDHG
jgi:hypothetical protein